MSLLQKVLIFFIVFPPSSQLLEQAATLNTGIRGVLYLDSIESDETDMDVVQFRLSYVTWFRFGFSYV